MPWSERDIDRANFNGITLIADVVAAPGAGRRIIVLGFVVSMAAAGTVLWSSGAAAITGTTPLGAGIPLRDSDRSLGVLVCAENQALRLTASVAASGYVRYVVAPA